MLQEAMPHRLVKELMRMAMILLQQGKDIYIIQEVINTKQILLPMVLLLSQWDTESRLKEQDLLLLVV